jgi:hypothetical protein
LAKEKMTIFVPELSESEAEAGIYIIGSNHQTYDEKNKVVVKIGRASNMRKRLNSYGICFPDGARILGLAVLPKRENEDKKQIIKNTAVAETKIHRFLTEKGVKWIYPNTDSVIRVSREKGRGEYFESTVKQLKEWFRFILEPLSERIYTDLYNPVLHFNPLTLEGELTKPQKRKRANMTEEQEEEIRNPSSENVVKAFERLNQVLAKQSKQSKPKQQQQKEEKELRRTGRKRKATSRAFNEDEFIRQQNKAIKRIL